MVESKLLNKQFKEAYQEGEDARETLIGAIPQSAASDAFSTYVLSGTEFFEDVTKQTSNFLDRANQVGPIAANDPRLVQIPKYASARPGEFLSSSQPGDILTRLGGDPKYIKNTLNSNLGGIADTSRSALANPYALSDNKDFMGGMVRDYYDPSKFTQFGRRPSNALNQAMSLNNPSLSMLTANTKSNYLPYTSNSFYTQTIPLSAQLR